MRLHQSSWDGSENAKSVESESSLERIHTFNLKAPDQSGKNSMATSVPSSPGGNSEKKLKNLRSLISLKVAAAE